MESCRVLYFKRCQCASCFRLSVRNISVSPELRAAGVRPVLPDPSESSNEVGSWLPPRPEEQVGRAPGGAALRGGVGGKGEAETPIQVLSDTTELGRFWSRVTLGILVTRIRLHLCPTFRLDFAGSFHRKPACCRVGLLL